MTTIELSEDLVRQAMRVADTNSETEMVENALRLLIRLKKQGDTLTELWGSANWEGDLEQSRANRLDD